MTCIQKQPHNMIVYQNAVVVFVTSEAFINCFDKLKAITQSVIIDKLHRSQSTELFENCKTVFEYFEMLEKSLGFQQQEWESYFSLLNDFFTEVMGETSHSIQGIKRDYRKFIKTSRGNIYFQGYNESTQNPNKKFLRDIYPKIEFKGADASRPHMKFDSGDELKTQNFFEAYNVPFKLLDPERYYSINLTSKRGMCLLINLYPKYSVTDTTLAQRAFEELNYKFSEFKIFTAQQYGDFKKRLPEDVEQLYSDSFILIFLSQGDQNNVIFSDGKKMDRADLITQFERECLQCLLGKPKLFFFQNFLGQEGYTEDTPELEHLVVDTNSTDAASQNSCSKPSTTIPSDVLSIYASTDSTVANGDESDSIYLQDLYTILLDPIQRRLPIKEILIELRCKVSNKLPTRPFDDDMFGSHLTETNSLTKIFQFCHPCM